jgi:hypothetical protein
MESWSSGALVSAAKPLGSIIPLLQHSATPPPVFICVNLRSSAVKVSVSIFGSRQFVACRAVGHSASSVESLCEGGFIRDYSFWG